MVLKVFRWSPGFPERLQRFWVPAKEGMTVLDALVDAQRRLDPTLAFRYACRVGMCGSCAMVVNGRERWACRTLLKSLKSGIVTVRPLYHFPLVRDLVVDMAPLVEQTARVGGVFVPADGPPTAARIGRTRRSGGASTRPSSASAAACACRPAPWWATTCASPGPPLSTASSLSKRTASRDVATPVAPRCS